MVLLSNVFLMCQSYWFVEESLSNLVFELFWSCDDPAGFCGFNSVFEFDASDYFGETVNPLSFFQFCLAHFPTINIMRNIPSRERHPLGRLINWRIVAKREAIGLLVRTLYQCWVGKSNAMSSSRSFLGNALFWDIWFHKFLQINRTLFPHQLWSWLARSCELRPLLLAAIVWADN
jgi:hypothetical protein